MSSASPNLRPASKEEAEILAGIHRACFPNYWNTESFSNFFAVPGTHALLAEAPELVAMMVYRAQFEQADIITLAVLPDWRRRGIARTLLERALSHLRELGARKIFLDVEDGNQAAISLYESHGFTLLRRRKNYYRQKDGTFTDALVLQRKLA